MRWLVPFFSTQMRQGTKQTTWFVFCKLDISLNNNYVILGNPVRFLQIAFLKRKQIINLDISKLLQKSLNYRKFCVSWKPCRISSFCLFLYLPNFQCLVFPGQIYEGLFNSTLLGRNELLLHFGNWDASSFSKHRMPSYHISWKEPDFAVPKGWPFCIVVDVFNIIKICSLKSLALSFKMTLINF